jgi:lipoyl(octanoyl) transferase
MTDNPVFQVISMGRLDYREAWDIQLATAHDVRTGQIPNTLILVEHNHVYTKGRLSPDSDLLLNQQQFDALQIPVVETDRGGLITYHGPGQLVAYPIINLRAWGGPLKYVRALEEIIISTLSDFRIEATTISGLTGVWVGHAKIAAIGVRISKGVSTHGLSLNVSTDLSYFKNIIPCGIVGRQVTSMDTIIQGQVEKSLVEQSFITNFSRVMELHLENL